MPLTFRSTLSVVNRFIVPTSPHCLHVPHHCPSEYPQLSHTCTLLLFPFFFMLLLLALLLPMTSPYTLLPTSTAGGVLGEAESAGGWELGKADQLEAVDDSSAVAVERKRRWDFLVNRGLLRDLQHVIMGLGLPVEMVWRVLQR
ncbi:hypothetical protein MIMGU_mgv1a015839mg [Erythranthe guttata]|uniref:Uncharacterized protein n=1 Tax=Erythranthe guttata TaxID=4155 RepID=A0A022PYP9_ERYGU|nr:hypothetical protein MIMGU_mgv1a015839mg [Erythranthe guttata]